MYRYFRLICKTQKSVSHLLTEMVIGFVERSTTVSEGFTGPFDDVFEIPIGVSSLIISEREYNVSFVVQDSDETIIVVGTNDVTLGFDAQFGVVEENSITADHILQIGEKDIVDELRVGIRNDLNPENTECFSLRIISTDIAGERFIFDCNDESESTPGFFCEHEICIIDDDGRYILIQYTDSSEDDTRHLTLQNHLLLDL